MLSDKAFWLVWCPERGCPTRPHETPEIALSEAHRLAKKHPGNKFYVLRAISVTQAVETVTTELR